MKRRPPSRLARRARAILARTAAARRALDARIAGVVLRGGPPELGAYRDTAVTAWLDRNITKARATKRRGRVGRVAAPAPRV